MIHLGVNIDHVATLRQARLSPEPDPVWAAVQCELAGAHNITVHLREDRRHIQDRDLEIIRKTVRTKLNLEMANIASMIKIAQEVKPDQVTLVPEKRQELTTEGGLDAQKELKALKEGIKKLHSSGIQTGIFIDPTLIQVESASSSGADFIEFHTGRFANAKNSKEEDHEIQKLTQAAKRAHSLSLCVHAGHGLHYINIHHMLKIPFLEEVNIGHAIISRAIFVGLRKAVREMLDLLKK